MGEQRTGLIRAVGVPQVVDPTRDAPTMSEATYLDLVRKRITVACRPDPARLRHLVEVLKSMRDLAARPFGVMLIPSEFQVEDRLWEAATAPMESNGLDRSEPQRSLVAALDAAGIPCLDLLPQLLER